LYFRAFGPFEEIFTMVYLDSRGSGRSEKAESTTEYTYHDFVADIDALRQHLGLAQVWLMGQSEGGVQVQHYAVEHPQQVAGLILLATLPASDAEWVADVRKGIEKHKEAPYYEAGVKAMQSMFDSDGRGWRGFVLDGSFDEMWQVTFPFYFSDFERFQKMAPKFHQTANHSEIAPPAEAFSADAVRGMTDSKRHPYNLIPRLQELDTPTLIVAGADDIVCSLATAERLHLALHHSKLLVIEQAGHFPWLEQPEQFFSGIKRFLPALGYTSN
jgi:proline iminopeptidase